MKKLERVSNHIKKLCKDPKFKKAYLKEKKQIKKLGWISHNIYKPGTAKYYSDQLKNISAVLIDYDGYTPNNAKQMRGLLEEVRDMADKALKHRKLYLKGKK